jgi:hypothetical protein
VDHLQEAVTLEAVTLNVVVMIFAWMRPMMIRRLD